MSSLYAVAPATLSDPLTTLLIMYGIVIGFDITSFVTILSLKNLLPKRFLLPGLAISFCLAAGLTTSAYFLLNISYACDLSRKVSYACNYLGYFIYDIYQVLDVIRVTHANWIGKSLLYALLCGRAASFIYNLYTVQGVIAVPVKEGDFIGAGPCKTSLDSHAIHQEHAVAIALEILILILVLIHARKLSNDSVSWKKIVTKVFNFEILTFFFYFFVEIGYIIAYQTIAPGYVSYLNTWYLQLPVCLFFANCLNFAAERRKKMILSLKDGTPTQSNQSSNNNLDEWIKNDSNHHVEPSPTKSGVYIETNKLIRNSSVLEHSRSPSNTKDPLLASVNIV